MIPVNSVRIFRATTHSTGYDGQVVTVLSQIKEFEDGSSLYVVVASDGKDFTATNSELSELVRKVFKSCAPEPSVFDGKVVEILSPAKGFNFGAWNVRAPDGTEFGAYVGELSDLTDTDNQTIKQLRDSGHVVIIWSPEELGDADPSTLEDIVIQRGNEYLEDVNEE